MGDVQEKMDQDLEVREHYMKENEDLRGKLTQLTETYDAQERQVLEQHEAREFGIANAQEQIVKHEAMCDEAKENTAYLEKQNEILRGTQPNLRSEVQSILAKFDEFRDSATGTNERHSECKSEIDNLKDELQELERVNKELKKCTRVAEIQQEQQTAQKQRLTLGKLCDDLQTQNAKLQEQVKSLRKKAKA